MYTIGHSTRSFDELVSLLKHHGVRTIADVRRFPRSRKYPHFNDDALTLTFPQVGIQYIPFPSLGGRRRTIAGSINTGWRNEGFRGYADYMQTREFQHALGQLSEVAGQSPTAIMCAESVPWRCHRSLIADAMLVSGWEVLDILSETGPKPHTLTPFAHVDGTRITYPSAVAESADGAPGLFDPVQ